MIRAAAQGRMISAARTADNEARSDADRENTDGTGKEIGSYPFGKACRIALLQSYLDALRGLPVEKRALTPLMRKSSGAFLTEVL